MHFVLSFFRFVLLIVYKVDGWSNILKKTSYRHDARLSPPVSPSLCLGLSLSVSPSPCRLCSADADVILKHTQIPPESLLILNPLAFPLNSSALKLRHISGVFMIESFYKRVVHPSCLPKPGRICGKGGSSH